MLSGKSSLQPGMGANLAGSNQPEKALPLKTLMARMFADQGTTGQVRETGQQNRLIPAIPFPALFPHSLTASNRLDSLEFSGGVWMLE